MRACWRKRRASVAQTGRSRPTTSGQVACKHAYARAARGRVSVTGLVGVAGWGWQIVLLVLAGWVSCVSCVSCVSEVSEVGEVGEVSSVGHVSGCNRLAMLAA